MIKTLDKDLIAYKKVVNLDIKAIVVMLIPKGSRYYINHSGTIKENTEAVRGNKDYRKMRADKAICLGIFGEEEMYSEFKHHGFHSARNKPCIDWIPGKLIKPDKFDDRDTDCVPGIHFFLNVNDAINWN